MKRGMIAAVLAAALVYCGAAVWAMQTDTPDDIGEPETEWMSEAVSGDVFDTGELPSSSTAVVLSGAMVSQVEPETDVKTRASDSTETAANTAQASDSTGTSDKTAQASDRTVATTTLEFGMFTGSNWNVANANSFVIIDKAIERFESEHPGVKVHYYSGVRKDDYSEWLARKLVSGEEPDVYMVLASDFDLYCSLGVLEGLDAQIRNDNTFDADNFFSTSLKTGQYGGKQYALPYETVPRLMFVNKTLLDEEGIEMPGQDWTWDDLYDICRKVTKDTDGDGVLDQFGIANYAWTDACYADGVTLFNDNGTDCSLTSEGMSETLRYLRRLEALNGGQSVTQQDYSNGKVAFLPLTFAEYRTYKTYPYKIRKYAHFQWDCLTMPAGYSGDNVSGVDSLLIGISKRSTNRTLAWEFLKLLTSDTDIQTDIFRYSQGASVLKSVTDSSEMEMILSRDMEKGDTVISGELLSSVIEHGHVEPQFEKFTQAMTIANSGVDGILSSEELVDTQLKILQREVEATLKS